MQQTQASNKWNADSTYVLRMYIKWHGYHRIWCHRWKKFFTPSVQVTYEISFGLISFRWWMNMVCTPLCGQMVLLHTWCRCCPKSTMHWSLWAHWTTRYPVHSISVDSGDPQHLTTTSTLTQVLIKVKSHTVSEEMKGIVYQVPCKDCDGVYTGEFKRACGWLNRSAEVMASQCM